MNLLEIFFREPLLFLVIVLVFLIALSIHEASHALAAYWLGDMTAKRANRLTLNPAAHIDWLGFLVLITVGFGWGKPVPFNPYNLKYPRWGPALIAAAGPASNFLLGIVFALVYRAVLPGLGQGNLLAIFLQYGAYLSFLLGLFNLFPIPPLDGSKALLAALAHEKYRGARFFIETRGTFLLLGLILIDAVLQVGIFRGLGSLATGFFSLIVG
jgi:Zn-dependent protease